MQRKRSCSTATMSRRAIARMAHEVVERNADRDSPLAIVGIHRRGVHLAERLHAQISELVSEPVALGSLDISFHRTTTSGAPQAPVVRATAIDFALDGATVVVVDDVLFTGRTVARRSTLSSNTDARRGFSSPRSSIVVTASFRFARLHRQEPADVTCRAGHVRIAELDGSDQVTSAPRPTGRCRREEPRFDRRSRRPGIERIVRWRRSSARSPTGRSRSCRRFAGAS